MQQRKKGITTKASISGSIPIQLKEELIKIMEKDKKSYTEVITEAIKEYVNKKGEN